MLNFTCSLSDGKGDLIKFNQNEKKVLALGFKMQIRKSLRLKKNTPRTKTTEDKVKELTSELKNKITLIREEMKKRSKVISNYSQIVLMTKKEYKKLEQEHKKLKKYF